MPVIQPPTMTSMRRLLASALLLVVIAVVAGCASRTRAPVEDRATQPGRPPQPAVVSPSTVPPPAATAGTEAGGPTYVVKRGDTLYQIALDSGLDYKELAAWNNIENVNVIRVGQVLRLTAPGFDSTTDGAGRSGAVVTPDGDTAGSDPGAVSRSTCPTRMTFTFSMLFQAASSL